MDESETPRTEETLPPKTSHRKAMVAMVIFVVLLSLLVTLNM